MKYKTHKLIFELLIVMLLWQQLGIAEPDLLRPVANSERDDVLSLKATEAMVLSVKKEWGKLQHCLLNSLYLARAQFKAGIPVRIMSDGKHIWVEQARTGGYAIDSFPKGYIKLGQTMGDAEISNEYFLILEKDSDRLAAFRLLNLYQGAPRNDLTEIAAVADDEEFYERVRDYVFPSASQDASRFLALLQTGIPQGMLSEQELATFIEMIGNATRAGIEARLQKVLGDLSQAQSAKKTAQVIAGFI